MALGSTITGGLVALPFAFAGAGVDALVYQRLAGTVFFALTACWVARWVPPRPPALGVLRDSFRFSLPLMQAALIDYFSITGYVMLIGLRMAMTDVGQFRIAQRLLEVLQEIAFAPARKVFLPVFVVVRTDPARHYEATRKLLDVLSVTMFFCRRHRRCRGEAAYSADVRPALGTGGAGLLDHNADGAGNRTLWCDQPAADRCRPDETGLAIRFGNAAIILLTVWLAAPAGLKVLAWALAGRGYSRLRCSFLP